MRVIAGKARRLLLKTIEGQDTRPTTDRIKETLFNILNAAECIRENLQTTKLEEESVVMNCDVLTGLRRLEGKDYVFDFVFMDPPYGKELERQVLEYLASSPLISEDTLLIVEADLNTGFEYLESMGYECRREKIYKTNKHVFIAKGVVL